MLKDFPLLDAGVFAAGEVHPRANDARVTRCGWLWVGCAGWDVVAVRSCPVRHGSDRRPGKHLNRDSGLFEMGSAFRVDPMPGTVVVADPPIGGIVDLVGSYHNHHRLSSWWLWVGCAGWDVVAVRSCPVRHGSDRRPGKHLNRDSGLFEMGSAFRVDPMPGTVVVADPPIGGIVDLVGSYHNHHRLRISASQAAGSGSKHEGSHDREDEQDTGGFGGDRHVGYSPFSDGVFHGDAANNTKQDTRRVDPTRWGPRCRGSGHPRQQIRMARPLRGVTDLHDRDRRARQTYNDHIDAISRYATMRAGRTHGPDMVQEAFQILFAHDVWLSGRLDSVPHGHKRVAKFLRTTVDNRYKMLLRGSDRRRLRELRVFRRERNDGSFHDTIPYLEEATIAYYLQHLEPREAQAIRLFVSHLTSNEIADEMGIRPDSVRKNLRRGLAKLAELFEPDEDNPR